MNRTVHFYPDFQVYKYAYQPPRFGQTKGENDRLRRADGRQDQHRRRKCMSTIALVTAGFR